MINWKRLFFLIIVLTFMAGVAYLALSLFGPRVYVEPESVRINRQKLETLISNEISSYKTGETSVIDFSAIKMPFSWDRLYVFGPYTTSSKIDKVLGKSWNDKLCVTTIIGNDGIALLIFTNNGQVVQCLDYGRDGNDFDNLEKHETGIPIEQAHFILDERENLIWVNSK